ncbi:ENTH-domain-containing protein [Mycena sanguinolenta]|uniref:ENTH-domain-containing protein n=1 Tax=Mycena sanguinolenta TaxID=230812 RepID=A0A8H6YFM4_9AGAR|nr:ENTH-domain-containing protein [Mycena sanguinolenta]
MDRLEALGTALSQVTMYDIKSMYNQAKNVVLNVSEIEAKVREATNDEPCCNLDTKIFLGLVLGRNWYRRAQQMGSELDSDARYSKSVQHSISMGLFPTVSKPGGSRFPAPTSTKSCPVSMPVLWKRKPGSGARFTRRVALQLLEYLIKNGSERVVDDARSHISTLKMLRNFHYIDDKGKDEGVNVRNRSRELVELLSDVDKIRGERRKAKANKHKYTGTGNDGLSFASESGGRYGGFGSDSLSYGGGGSSGSDYYSSGGGSSSRGGGSSGFRDERRGGFDEYNAGDDEIDVGRTTSPVNTRAPPVRKSTAPPPPPPPAAPVNLFDPDDDDGFGAAPAVPAPPVNKSLPARALPAPAAPAAGLIDDDDFDDFQAAPVQAAPPVQAAAPARASAAFGGMTMTSPIAATPAAPPAFAQQQPPRTGMGMMGAPMGAGMARAPLHRLRLLPAPLQPQTPNYTGMSGMAPMAPGRPMGMGMGMGMGNTAGSPAPAPATPSKPASSFDDLWSMSLGSGSGSGGAAKPATPGAGAASGGKSIKDLEKEKAMAGLWGSGQQPQKPAAMGSGMMGMGMGGGGMGGGFSASSSGVDDLLG